MIPYNAGTWGLFFIFKVGGSVFPKAMVWAIPNAVMAACFKLYLGDRLVSMEGMDELWSGYTFVLGFLIVFRNNQAYSRFWEGATLINQVRGEWFNAVSSLVAFCNRDPAKSEQVTKFQHLLIRLASLLYCNAVQQVCDLKDDTLEIIDPEGIDAKSLLYLVTANDRCEVIIQWIQRLIVDAEASGVVKIAPPILSRAYQEMSRGIVNLNNVRKIKDIPFPFPYAQMITCMLVVHWCITPVLASNAINSWWCAAMTCFFVQMAFWSLLYIALEIDQPFGEDPNDLPVDEMQKDFNRSLLGLLQPLAQTPPTYRYHHRVFVVRSSTLDKVGEEICRPPTPREEDYVWQGLPGTIGDAYAKDHKPPTPVNYGAATENLSYAPKEHVNGRPPDLSSEEETIRRLEVLKNAGADFDRARRNRPDTLSFPKPPELPCDKSSETPLRRAWTHHVRVCGHGTPGPCSPPPVPGRRERHRGRAPRRLVTDEDYAKGVPGLTPLEGSDPAAMAVNAQHPRGSLRAAALGEGANTTSVLAGSPAEARSYAVRVSHLPVAPPLGASNPATVARRLD